MTDEQKALNARLDAENCNQLPCLRFGPAREPGEAMLLAGGQVALDLRHTTTSDISIAEAVWNAMWEESQNVNS